GRVRGSRLHAHAPPLVALWVHERRQLFPLSGGGLGRPLGVEPGPDVRRRRAPRAGPGRAAPRAEAAVAKAPINLVRLSAWLADVLRGKTRTSRFARLAQAG